MDPTTRRLAAIGLALTVVSTVYAVRGDWIQAGIALGGVVVCLLWGFWPDLRRKGKRGDGRASVTVEIRKAEVCQRERRGEPSMDVLALELLATTRNPLDQEIKIRPTGLLLFRDNRQVPATLVPRIFMDPMGRSADFSSFEEGQHATPAHSEMARSFFFDAIPLAEGMDVLLKPGLELRLTVSIPGPWPDPEFTLPIAVLPSHSS